MPRLVIAVTVMAVVFAGCGGDDKPTATTAPTGSCCAPTGSCTVTIRYRWSWSGTNPRGYFARVHPVSSSKTR